MNCCVTPEELPHTQPSPRLIYGELRWYAGDTFDLTIDIDLTDQCGHHVSIEETDSVIVDFFNSHKKIIKTFIFTNIVDDSITLQFDEETSSLFTRGFYTYDIYLKADKRKTLANDNKVVVE